MKPVRLGIVVGLCLCFFGAGLSAWAIPANMSVNGRLLDKNGNPVYYMQQSPEGPPYQLEVNLPAKIKLYDSATAATPFITLTSTARAFDAYFTINFALPEAAVVKDSLWYALSIDVDRNGLTSADDFPDRFEIGSVPFAMSSKPMHYYTTFGGGQGYGVNTPKPANTMEVCPFETPPSAVVFNRMNVFLPGGQANTAFSFGIYDQEGKLVVWSGRIAIGAVSLDDDFLEVKLSANVTLQPSAIYYVGVARSVAGGISIQSGIKPSAPVYGYVTIPKSTGEVPSSFDLDSIDANNYASAFPITLRLETAPAKPGTTWTGKPGGPQYRWITPKGTAGK